MVTTPKPPTKARPKSRKPPQAADKYQTVSSVYLQEEEQHAQEWQEWDAASKPPLTPEQLRLEYDDALSFLLLLESRINRLEQAEARHLTAHDELVVNGKIHYLFARSRTSWAKERRAKLATAEQDGSHPLRPPYDPQVTLDAEPLYTFMLWSIEAYPQSALYASQTEEQRTTTKAATAQLARSIIDYVNASAGMASNSTKATQS